MTAAPAVATVRVGSLRLDVRAYADGRFGFDYQPHGEMRVKVRLRDQAAAERRARELLAGARGGRVDWLSVDPERFARFLRWEVSTGREQPSAVTAAAFLRSKEGKGLSILHTHKLRSHLRDFTEQFPGPIGDVQRDDFEQWLNSRNLSPRSWNNFRASIVALYRFARHEGNVSAAPSGPERTHKRKVLSVVQTYSPEELRQILAVVEPEWLPVVALQAFAGMRPEEACPQPYTKKPGLTWGCLIWSKSKIDVPSNVAKTRRRRFAPLLPVLAAFLAPWRTAPRDAAIAPRREFHKQTMRWSKASGVPWRRDALRHSFASYRLALTANLPALALEMGNSVDVIHQSYLDLKHEEEAQEWFAIRPQSSKSSIRTSRRKPKGSHSADLPVPHKGRNGAVSGVRIP